MRTQLLAMLLTAALTAGLVPALAGASGNLVPGQPAPDFALKSVAGKNQRLSEWQGDVVVLTFWADWCGRCSDQLQELARLQEHYGERGVRVVAVNIDRDGHAAREAAARSRVLVLHDSDQSVARQYQLSSLPLTVLVDAHGTVRHVHEKYRGGDAALYDEELAALLQE
ncbi:MAG: TlpA family protein disulfide reductase [Chromatiales bacterium]|nr:TlpA family protein disulfide reductase [Chromatiales bacterium]